MVVAALVVDIFIPGSSSLKGKRMVIKGLKDKLRHRFNLSVSEVDHNDLWQRAELAIVGVSNEANGLFSVLQRALQLIEGDRRVQVLNYTIERY